MEAENSFEFYKSIDPIKNKKSITDLSYYKKCPDNCYLIMTDIKGSTLAIEKGFQKNVNLIGAAAIAALQSCLGTREIPFTFGGDGATFIIPNQYLESVHSELLKLKNHAQKVFQLELRVNVIPIKDIYNLGGIVHIGRYQLAENNFIALFAGSGFSIAEKILKSNSHSYELNNDFDSLQNRGSPNLENLSCRWDKIPSKKGVIVSIVVIARDEVKSQFILARILNKINQFADDDMNNKRAEMKPLSLSKQLKSDLMINHGSYNVFKLLKFLLRYLFVTYTLKTSKNFIKSVDINSYLDETYTNSDYTKIDYSLKMVVDCSVQSKEEIISFLHLCFESKEIYYGTHVSDSALMTCVVHQISQNQHIHFIDGNNGGYTFAAKELKKQMLT